MVSRGSRHGSASPQGREAEGRGSIQSPRGSVVTVEGVIAASPGTGPHLLGGDAELRELAISWLRATGPGHVLSEVGLEHGDVRTDLLLLSETELHGLEVKSERDTLKRLPAQVRAYSAALSRCTLAVAESHLGQAQSMVPPWWGLLVATRRLSLHLVPVRQPQPNPTPSPAAMVKLLWRDEAWALLKELGKARGQSRGTRGFFYRQLAECLPVDQLQAKVRATLLAREDWLAERLP